MRIFISCVLLAAAATAAQAAPDPPKKTTTVLEGQHPALPTAQNVGPPELKHYRLPASTFKIQFGESTTGKQGVRVHTVTFPSPVTKRWGTIHGKYFRPRGATAAARVPAAVVVHHLGGFKEEWEMAQHLAENGVATFAILLPNYGARREPGSQQGFLRSNPLGAFKTFQQAVQDVIRAGDFLRSRPEIDPARVGLLGVSLGALVGSVAKGVDMRFRQTVLVLGGGNLLSLVTARPGIERLFGKRGDLNKMLGPLLRPIDATTFSRRVNSLEVLMINATQDEVIPRKSTDALWNSFGKPRILWFECNHTGLRDHIPAVVKEALQHLRGRAWL